MRPLRMLFARWCWSRPHTRAPSRPRPSLFPFSSARYGYCVGFGASLCRLCLASPPPSVDRASLRRSRLPPSIAPRFAATHCLRLQVGSAFLPGPCDVPAHRSAPTEAVPRLLYVVFAPPAAKLLSAPPVRMFVAPSTRRDACSRVRRRAVAPSRAPAGVDEGCMQAVSRGTDPSRYVLCSFLGDVPALMISLAHSSLITRAYLS